MQIIPLKMIEDGKQFRMPGRQAIFTKISDFATIDIQLYQADGKPYIESRAACRCRTANGKIFTEDWFFMVEKV